MKQKEGNQVTLHIVNNSNCFIGEPVYVASNFNNWRADDFLAGSLPEIGGKLRAVLDGVPAGALELKLTRGSWGTLQSSTTGKLMPPVVIDIERDTEVALSIEAWRDQFPLSTASPQVHVLEERFYFPKLDRYRKVWIYLPVDYATSGESYPVLYMHDGQHLFDEATSVGRAGPVEWMVDETIDASFKQAIVVGIDHADTYAERQQEFLFHPFEETTEANGSAYLADIVYVLKPYVDAHYRTLSAPEHTIMVGSSIGGLITLYAGLLYPQVFGLVGVFSPSIWMDHDGVFEEVAKELEQKESQTFYFYVGAKEQRMGKHHRAGKMLDDIDELLSVLSKRSQDTLKLDVDPEGKHGALYWQRAFKRFYHWWEQEYNK